MYTKVAFKCKLRTLALKPKILSYTQFLNCYLKATLSFCSRDPATNPAGNYETMSSYFFRTFVDCVDLVKADFITKAKEFRSFFFFSLICHSLL